MHRRRGKKTNQSSSVQKRKGQVHPCVRTSVSGQPGLCEKTGGKNTKQEVVLLMEKSGGIPQTCPGWGGTGVSFKAHRVIQSKKATGKKSKTHVDAHKAY